MYIDIKTLEGSKFKNFVNKTIKENEYIVVSNLEKNTAYCFGENVDLPNDIDYRNINVSKYEYMQCYKINYYMSSLALNNFNSMMEFFNFTNIYRLMFVAKSKVTIECMSDGIIVYEDFPLL